MNIYLYDNIAGSQPYLFITKTELTQLEFMTFHSIILRMFMYFCSITLHSYKRIT